MLSFPLKEKRNTKILFADGLSYLLFKGGEGKKVNALVQWTRLSCS